MLVSLCLIAAATAALLFMAAVPASAEKPPPPPTADTVPEASVRPSTTLSGRTASVYEADTESNLVLNHGDGGTNVSVP